MPENEKIAHPSDNVHIFEGRQALVDIATFELPNGLAYARISTRAIGGEAGAGEIRSGASADELFEAIRWMQSLPHVRECGFEGHGFGKDALIDCEQAESTSPWPAGVGRVQRVSASNWARVCNLIAQSLDMIASRGGLLGWSAMVNGDPVDLRSWGASSQRADHVLDLGRFCCVSDELWVGDPDDAPRNPRASALCGAFGDWRAYSTRRGCGNWGDRCSQLLIAKEGLDPLDWLAEAGSSPWIPAGMDCDVNSGAAGFFDLQARSGDGNKGLDEECMEKTAGFVAAGVVGGGAACRSGSGDGAYPVDVARAADGTLLAARILFYERQPSEINAFRRALAEREALSLDAVAGAGIQRAKARPI